MNRASKNFAILLAACMIMSLAGCSKDIKDDTNVPHDTSATSAGETDASVSVTGAAKKQTKTKAKGSLNMLSGNYDVTKNAVGKRPVAIMVNNVDASMPQYGIYNADILVECPVEGGITRLMAMFGDYTKVPDVCSVRSCRYYYALLANSFDAVYLHWGIDKKIAQGMLDKLKIDHIDGNVNETLFKRDPDRLNNYDLEHTGYCDGSLIPEQIKNAGIRTNLREENKTPIFFFNSEFAKTSTVKCNRLQVDFSDSYSSLFKYDSKNKIYKKFRNGGKHMDAKKNKQLDYTNIFVLESKSIKIANQNNGLLKVDWSGGNGYYATGGTIRKIKWKKDSELGKIVFTNKDGSLLKVNTGKSYICLTKSKTMSYQ